LAEIALIEFDLKLAKETRYRGMLLEMQHREQFAINYTILFPT